jgi:cysteine desulfurase
MSFVYLDWAATAPPDPEILDSVNAVATAYFGNPSAPHAAGRKAEKFLEENRARLAELLRCDPQEIIFTSGGTESNNMVILSLLHSSSAGATGAGGDTPERPRSNGPRKVVLSGIEHASVHRPALALQRYGVEVLLVPAEADGRVDPERVVRAVDERTALVALMLVNNETGAIQPVAEVARALHRSHDRAGRKVHLHCDAVQALGKVPVLPRELGVDSLSLSAHKMGGPRGTGALYLARSSRRQFLYSGGDQEAGRRPGTENLPGIHGLVLSAERAYHRLPENLERMRRLTAELLESTSALEGVAHVPSSRRFAPDRFSPYIVTLAFPPVPGEVMVRVLEEEGYLISTGSACSSRRRDRFRVHENMGIPEAVAFSSVRLSFGPATNSEVLHGLVGALNRRLPELRRVAAR